MEGVMKQVMKHTQGREKMDESDNSATEEEGNEPDPFILLQLGQGLCGEGAVWELNHR